MRKSPMPSRTRQVEKLTKKSTGIINAIHHNNG